jgi:hypothetical protein
MRGRIALQSNARNVRVPGLLGVASTSLISATPDNVRVKQEFPRCGKGTDRNHIRFPLKLGSWRWPKVEKR